MDNNVEPVYVDVPKEGLYLVPLGGVGEIGMNFYLYCCDGQWIVVDCGVGFAGDNCPGIDMLIPSVEFIQSKGIKVDALIITHAHEDHLGAVGFLWRDLHCPIYTTDFCAEMLETKLDEAGLLGRVNVERFNDGDELELGNFDIEFYGVNHSVPEACALLIKTKYGNVFHTGDWRFDKDPVVGKLEDLNKLKKEKILAVVGDSTNVFVEEDIASEMEVRESLVELFSKYKGRGIAVTCFASNVGRIESIAYAANRNNREVCLVGKSLWRVEGAGRACGYFRDYPALLTDDEAREYEPDKIVYVCTGCQGESRAALNSLSYDVGPIHLKKNDVVIFSSRVIPGNETAINNIQNRFIAKGIEVVTTKEALTHVSGHSSKKDIQKLYDILKPEISIPVHGETSHLYEHADVAQEKGVKKVHIIKDGDVVRIEKDNSEIIGEVVTGILALDGKKLIPLRSDVLKKRRRMIEDGSVVATVVLDKEGNVFGKVQFSAVGLIEENSPEFDKMDENVKLELSRLTPESRLIDQTVIDTVKSASRKIVMEVYGRRPMVDVHLVRI
ncbi:MAG: ribonuclease J [Alphaproteobacteria bacterium]|nr:ribonuclease J [Alphaproteobacteria bacterium]